MNRHCKGCKHHHNAKHKITSKYAKDFNDWCCNYSVTARKIISHCKIMNGKEAKKDE